MSPFFAEGDIKGRPRRIYEGGLAEGFPELEACGNGDSNVAFSGIGCKKDPTLVAKMEIQVIY